MREYLAELWALYAASPLVGQTATVIVSITLLLILARIARRVVNQHVAGADSRYRARKVVTFASYFLAALIVGMVFSEKLTGLSVTLGVAGAGVAFALQEVIASAAGWAAIAFGRFFVVGDRVQLGGIKGDVIDIGALRTTIMECGDWVGADQYNGRIVRVANSFVFKEPVFNYSADFPFLWDEIRVPVRYHSDRKLVREIMLQVAGEIVSSYVPVAQAAWDRMVEAYRIEPASTEPQVFMIANDNWMEFSLRYVVDFKSRRGTKDRLFSRLLDEFDATGGKVEMASTTLELVAAPALKVGLEHSST